MIPSSKEEADLLMLLQLNAGLLAVFKTLIDKGVTTEPELNRLVEVERRILARIGADVLEARMQAENLKSDAPKH